MGKRLAPLTSLTDTAKKARQPMNDSTTALALAIPATEARQPDQSEQIALRLFARVDAYQGTPPERALWRELLILCAITGAAHHVALLIYMRSSEAGIVNDDDKARITIERLAQDAGLSERTVRRALPILQDARVIQYSRDRGRRNAYVIRMNCGGLDWRGVRARASRDRTQSPDSDRTQSPLYRATTEIGDRSSSTGTGPAVAGRPAGRPAFPRRPDR